MSDSKFRNQCDQLIQLLSLDKQHFFSLPDNASRIKYVFSLCESVPDLFPPPAISKHHGQATVSKEHGNTCFDEENYSGAIQEYNVAISMCPQDTLEGKKLYAIVISNRCAAFVNTGHFAKALKDITFLKQYGHHPNLEKIERLEADALLALSESEPIVERDHSEELNWNSGNLIYPALSSKLTVKNDKDLGRHVVAIEDINPGELLAVERPYATIMTTYTNCTFCSVSTNQVYACPKCSELYCSMECLENAETYHKHECMFWLPMYDIRTSKQVYIRLAFRMIVQRPLQQVLLEETYGRKNRNLSVYKSDDHYNITRLERHEKSRNRMLFMTIYATFMLKRLRITKYFDPEAPGELSREEIIVGELLYKYLQVLQFNLNSIDEIRPINASLNIYKSVGIGVGLYLTMSLFNHSCDPSAMVYNIKDVSVLRCLKPLKAGDPVTVSYGWWYVTQRKEERVEAMNESYFFKCKCQACVEDWPVYVDMNPNDYLVLCDCGGILVAHNKISRPSAICPKCHKRKNFRAVRKIMMKLEATEAQANKHFLKGDFDNCRKLYEENLATLYQLFAHPCEPIIRSTEMIIKCLDQRGNRHFQYRLVKN